MVVVGLTGGIGSGKSTVAALMVASGAHLIDADRISRQVVEPGRPAYERVVERFGHSVVAPDGWLDRTAIAAIVFADEDARRDLNAIVHPAVFVEMASQLNAAREANPSGVAVLDIPLLAESSRSAYRLDGVIVVDTPTEVAIDRLVQHRGFDVADAKARVAAQATREERRGLADFVIDNSGSEEDLTVQVAAAFDWIATLTHS